MFFPQPEMKTDETPLRFPWFLPNRSRQDIDPDCRLAAAKAVAKVKPDHLPEEGRMGMEMGGVFWDSFI